MAEDNDEFGSGDFMGVFEGADHVVVDDITRKTKAENIPETEIEDVFDGGPRILATDDGSEGVLPVGGGFNLCRKIAGRALASQKPGVALLQAGKGSPRRHQGLIGFGDYRRGGRAGGA